MMVVMNAISIERHRTRMVDVGIVANQFGSI